MKVAIVNYGMGNITSVKNSLRFLGFEVDVIDSPDEFSNFDVFILPGVGAFGKAMEKLVSSGLSSAILKAAEEKKKIIGICLGMQLLFERSYEFGEQKGLGLIKGEVLPLRKEIDLRVPHMGWNTTISKKDEFQDSNDDYYYVHSFYCKPENDEDILFETNYDISFCSGVKKGNHIFGLQFHPEKSQKNGIELLRKIIENG
tara:strand:- start:1324 stop:1926 length:603 start_codon:yes stop_codon:yes gene_type:complete